MSSGTVNSLGRNALFDLYQLEIFSYISMCLKAVENNELLPWPPPPYPEWRKEQSKDHGTVAANRRAAVQQWVEVFEKVQTQPPYPKMYDHVHNILEASSPHEAFPGSLFAQLMNIAHRYNVGFAFSLVNRDVSVDALEFGPDYNSFQSRYSDEIPCLCVSYFSPASMFMSTIAGHIDSAVHRIMYKFNATLVRDLNLVLTRDVKGKPLSSVSHVIQINPVQSE